MKKHFVKRNSSIVVIALVFGFVAFIGIAFMTHLFTATDLPLQISGTFLQAVITAIMTYCLLVGQTASEESRERNIRTFEQKIDVYSEFVETMWKMFERGSDGGDDVTTKELSELRAKCFNRLVFYLDDQQIQDIAKQIKQLDALDDGKDKRITASIITRILRSNLEGSKEKLELPVDGIAEDQHMRDLFKSFGLVEETEEIVPDISSIPDNFSASNNSSVSDISSTSESGQLISQESDVTYWHLIAYGEEQFAAFKKGNWILGLNESWEDTWRTNAVRAVKPNDIIFLFRRGGGGYIGAFRALEPSFVYIDKENANEYSQEEKDLYDMGHELATGARIACILVEPIAFNYKGVGCKTVRRRTIERINDAEAVKFLLDRFAGKRLDRDQSKAMGKLDENTPIKELNSEYFNIISSPDNGNHCQQKKHQK
jgi:hypothetical protein